MLYDIFTVLFVIALFLKLRWKSSRIFVIFNKITRIDQKYCFIIFIILSLFTNILVSFWGYPIPSVHDEFSYLLQADIFAHWNLSEPPHIAWESFDTFHVLQNPSYASKYPPGQSLSLALGETLCKSPVYGLWIQHAALYAIFYWSLRGWFNKKWAFIATFIAMSNFFISHWANNYWGGNLALIGSCLAVGSVGYILKEDKRSLTIGFCYGAGLGILSITRPFEGFLLSALLLLGFFRYHIAYILKFRNFLPSLFLILSLFIGFQLLYNRAVTGNPFIFPYTLYLKKYDSEPLFVFGSFHKEITYSNEVLRKFYGGFVLMAERPLTNLIFDNFKTANLIFYCQPFVLAGFLYMLLCMRKIKKVFLMLTFVLIIFRILMLLEIFAWPHYYAVILPIFIIIGVSGIQKFIIELKLKFKNIYGLILVLLFMSSFVESLVNLKHRIGIIRNPPISMKNRINIEKSLISQYNNTLVFVYYGEKHSLSPDWVYNGANRETSPVLWVRDLGYFKNKKLIDSYPGWKTLYLKIEDDNISPVVGTVSFVSDLKQGRDNK